MNRRFERIPPLPVLVIIALFLIMGAGAMRIAHEMPAYAQEKPKAICCELTETQHLKLENVQLKYALAKTQFDAAQKALNEAAAAFNSEVDAVKKENSWPADLAFDFQALKFTEVPKPAEKPKPADPPAAKPAEKKKP